VRIQREVCGRMMKNFAILLCICQGVFGSMEFTSPVLAWSNMEYFAGQNLQVNDIVSTNLFSKGSRYIKEEKKPEVVFVFAEPELRTEHLSLLTQSHEINPNGGSLGNIKALMESFSTSSISLPYISSQDGYVASSFVNNIAQRYKSPILIATNKVAAPAGIREFSETMTQAELLNKITSGNWEVLNNGITEVVYVTFDSPAVHEDGASQLASYKADDEFVMKVHNALKSHSVSYVAAFTSQKTHSTSIEAHFQSRMTRPTAFQAVKPGGSIYWPPIVNEVILLMAPLILILVIGICCTSQIQSAYKFETPERKKQ